MSAERSKRSSYTEKSYTARITREREQKSAAWFAYGLAAQVYPLTALQMVQYLSNRILLHLMGYVLSWGPKLPFVWGRVCRSRADQNTNRSLQGGSVTAWGVTVLKAADYAAGIGEDSLARYIMSDANSIKISSYPTVQWLIQKVILHFFLRGWTLLYQLLGVRLFEPWNAWCTLRNSFSDDVVEEFRSRHTGKSKQLVILGAGFDSRLYRKKYKDNFKLFEVDAPGTQTAKLKCLEKLRKKNRLVYDPEITFVSVDFSKEDWITKLKEAGFSTSIPTCVIWEGVTMYLKKDSVMDTLKTFQRSCAKGSIISFDYMFGDFVTEFAPLMKKVGEPLYFGMVPGAEEHFIDDKCGLKLVDRLSPKELYARYLPADVFWTSSQPPPALAWWGFSSPGVLEPLGVMAAEA